MEKQLVIFELAGEQFGIDIASVEGIVKMQKITRVPHAPAFVEGVTNLRGLVLPVIDLEKRFGIPSQERTTETRIVVTNMGDHKIGMIVAAVSEVLTIEDNIIEKTPGIVISIDADFITGIAKIGSRLVILLDLQHVLSTEEKQQAVALMPA